MFFNIYFFCLSVVMVEVIRALINSEIYMTYKNSLYKNSDQKFCATPFCRSLILESSRLGDLVIYTKLFIVQEIFPKITFSVIFVVSCSRVLCLFKRYNCYVSLHGTWWSDLSHIYLNYRNIKFIAIVEIVHLF